MKPSFLFRALNVVSLFVFGSAFFSPNMYRHIDQIPGNDGYYCKRPNDYWDSRDQNFRYWIAPELKAPKLDVIDVDLDEGSRTNNGNITDFKIGRGAELAKYNATDSPQETHDYKEFIGKSSPVTIEVLAQRNLLPDVGASADSGLQRHDYRRAGPTPREDEEQLQTQAREVIGNQSNIYYQPIARLDFSNPWDEFPDRELDMRLACDTGRTYDRCFGNRYPTCANLCETLCAAKCGNAVGPASVLQQCMRRNHLSPCAFQFYVTAEIPLDQVCQQTMSLPAEHFGGSTQFGRRNGTSTTYFFRQSIEWKMNVPNLKRLERAAVVFQIERDFFPGIEGVMDFGNLAMMLPPDQVLFDARRTTSAVFGKCYTPWQPWHLHDAFSSRVYRHTPMAKWYRRRLINTSRTQVETKVQIEADITPWFKSAVLQRTGRDLPWIVIWWPGEQPSLVQDFQPVLKIQTKSPPGNVLTTEGLRTEPSFWDLNNHGSSLAKYPL